MEGLVGTRFDVANAVRKKRSTTSRRPRPDTPTVFDNRDHSPSSSTPPSDAVSKVSSDENAGYNTGSRRKEINLNSSNFRPSSINRAGGLTCPKNFRKDDGPFGEIDDFYRKNSSRGGSSSKHEQAQNVSDFKWSSEGVLAPASWKGTSSAMDGFESQMRNSSNYDGNGRNGDNRSSGQSGGTSSGVGNRGDSLLHEHKLRKVKLKVGGVTHTIHAKSTSESASGGGHNMRSSRPLDVFQQRQKVGLQDGSDCERSPPDEMKELRGISWKGFRGERSTHRSKEDPRGRMLEGYATEKQIHGSEPSSEPVRKSKRVPKRRVLDGALDDADEDDEIRYLERLKTAKSSADYGSEFGDNGEENNKKRKTSKASKRKIAVGDDGDADEYGLSRGSKEGKKKSRLGRESEDIDYIEEDEDEIGSDVGFEAKRKKQRREYVDTLMDGKKEISLTMRQRALQSGKDVSTGANGSSVEFPNGLPPAPPRKQKEKLSEVDQQLKKAEAAQRRRMQNEKAALESQKEAIRKILGQDSSRKKREEKLRKRRDELAQEKAANAEMLASNTIRWVMGPNGTTVTFPKDAGLPSIFNSKPCSYPPPREKCAGPSCTNPYKYRDSKSKLPLCSLQCYRAVNQMLQSVTTC